ncbi:acetyl-CoA carboxylase biotin carboxylase subunit family protein [Limnohabitans sp.]|jgi:biotin carboxylase|uniref:acetyl-CoA carboxylase biotin carboxylase subunit family protein n=1 Tax=Limnohabitans sp. TaxID=1907725 RepID=UPI0037C15830
MKTLVLFNYDWDELGFARNAQRYPVDAAGFDLFSFPSNVQLAWFDIEGFVQRLAAKAKRRGWQAVVSNHEQFGVLAAALLAERMGWPGTPVAAVLACQHKLYARQVMAEVCPEASCEFEGLNIDYDQPVPEGLRYPAFVKPVKAAFSVLARTVHNREELQAHTRFDAWELWVIRHLVEPFERVVRKRLPNVPSAHNMLLEQPMHGHQYNLDGYVFEGQVHALGVVDALHYPNTQAFMRFEMPSRLNADIQARALAVARRFLAAVGFSHGLFNMEFFYDAAQDRLGVIEFNPRMASQFSDLYLRVQGLDLHALALALARGQDPADLPRAAPSAGAAASFVYRSFRPGKPVHMPGSSQKQALARAFPDALLFCFAKTASQTERDFKWLGSYRYGILHLGGADARQLRARCECASALLGWPLPYADAQPDFAHTPSEQWAV